MPGCEELPVWAACQYNFGASFARYQNQMERGRTAGDRAACKGDARNNRPPATESGRAIAKALRLKTLVTDSRYTSKKLLLHHQAYSRVIWYVGDGFVRIYIACFILNSRQLLRQIGRAHV